MADWCNGSKFEFDSKGKGSIPLSAAMNQKYLKAKDKADSERFNLVGYEPKRDRIPPDNVGKADENDASNVVKSSESEDVEWDSVKTIRLSCRNWEPKSGGSAVHYRIHMAPQPDPLAQSVEHLTFNQVVRGSNPRWITVSERKQSPNLYM